MAGKNTAAFGIYHDEASLRNGVNTLDAKVFAQPTYRSCSQETSAPRILHMKKEPRHLKEPQREPALERL